MIYMVNKTDNWTQNSYSKHLNYSVKECSCTKEPVNRQCDFVIFHPCFKDLCLCVFFFACTELQISCSNKNYL